MTDDIKRNEESADAEAGPLNGRPVEESEIPENKKCFFSIISSSMDLANLKGLIYLCYIYGGGTFMISYCTMFIVIGTLLIIINMFLTQQFKKIKNVVNKFWENMVPSFNGIGYIVYLIKFYQNCSNNIIVAWSIQILLASISSTSSENLKSIFKKQDSDEIHDMEIIKWELVVCLFILLLLHFLASRKLIRMSDRVNWFTAFFPYVGMLAFLVRVHFLPGSYTGIKYFLRIDFDVINKAEVWLNAALQVLSLLVPKLALYNKNKFHVCECIILPSCINLVASFISGLIFFSILGYMAKISGLNIEDVATEAPVLMFEVYAAAIAAMPGSFFWAFIFFMTLLTFGVESSYDGTKTITTAISKEFPQFGSGVFVAILFLLYFVVGLLSCTHGDFYFYQLLDKYGAGYSFLLAVLSMGVYWIYVKKRFCWIYCCCYIALLFMLLIIFDGLLSYNLLTLPDYNYQSWANILGWSTAISTMIVIPAMAIYKICNTKGSFLERFETLISPRDQQVYINGITED